MMVIVLLEAGRIFLGRTIYPAHQHWLFYLDSAGYGNSSQFCWRPMMSVAVPIKIWNNTRVEMNLEQHQQLLAEGAHGRALQPN